MTRPLSPQYDLRRTTENIGGVSLELETVADLDQAISKLCEGVDEKDAEAVFVLDLCPYFGVLWPAARALGEHLARMGGWLKGKTVLELGCGLALPSLVSAKLGAQVTATDFHPDVGPFLTKNLVLNGLSLDYRELDWKKENTGLGTYDFVIGSDILYESSHPADVAHQLAAHCKRDGHIILADPGRIYLQPCTDAIKTAGFHGDVFIKEVADPNPNRAGDKKTKEVFVLSFRRK